MTIRLGAFNHLVGQPLVHGLDRQPERFSIQLDVPSKCATWLHEKAIDVGLIPSIEYLQSPKYRIVPGVAISSDGVSASATVFSPRPVAAIRSVAIDSGSRSSAALLRILCAQWFDIEPKLLALPPDLPTMLKRCDAALLIGDAALFTDHDALGLERTDLGAEWTVMTGLPFVHAVWAGRSGSLSADDVRALTEARDAGRAHGDDIARAWVGDDEEKAQRGSDYLRQNVSFELGERERAGLLKFLEMAVELRIAASPAQVQFF